MTTRSRRRWRQANPEVRKPHRIGFWWFAYVAFVIYGSLVPLQYTPLGWDDAWTTFQQIRLLDVGAGGRADWVANGVLYVPVGFLTALLLGARHRGAIRLAACLGAMVFVAALAVSIEFVQLAFPPRTVSLNDLMAELLGGGLGVALAGVADQRLRGLRAALNGLTDRLAPRLLEVYALAYFAFSLFPYDFLLSAGELAGKAQSDNWSWVWAAGSGRGTGAAAAAKMAAEALAAAPIGMLLATRGRTPAQGLRIGLALGVVIEFAQFFLVSGVSQGLSVLTRALGSTVGVVAWQRRKTLDPLRLAAAVRRSGLLLIILYLLALAAVTGWFELQWQGPQAAIESFREVRFLPFYYHYYTTEQAALLSLVSVCLMYAPVGLLTWAWFLGPGMAAVMAMLAALLVESSKLFLVGLHPDPTNALLAGAAAWLGYWLAKGVARLSSRDTAQPYRAAARDGSDGQPGPRSDGAPKQDVRAQPRPDSTTSCAEHPGSRPATFLRRAVALALATTALFLAARFPSAPLALVLGLCTYLVLALRFKDVWLLVVPALLPLFYLAPWSGRIFFDEFDLLLLCSLAAALWQGRPRIRPLRMTGDGKVALSLFTVVYLHAIWRGLSGLGDLDFNSLASYYSPLNALRIGKGFFWALVLYPPLIAARRENLPLSNRLLATGLMLGLFGVGAVVLWERGVLHDIVYFQGWRELISSLLDFGTAYRITALFADMHTGGEAIDGYLSLAWPFAALALLTARTRGAAALGAVVTLAAFYAMVVTFSRGVYFGFGVSLITACLLGLLRYRKKISTGLLLLTMLCIGASVTVVVFAFRAGGIAAVAASVVAFAIGAACVFAREQHNSPPAPTIAGLAAVSIAICVAVAVYAAATSKWTHISPGMGISISALSVVLFCLIGVSLNRGWRPLLSIRNRTLASLLICAAIAAFVPSLFGSRMEQRFATTTADLQHRIDHWRDAIDAMDDDWSTRLLGQGVGRFPERYYWVTQGAKDVGSFVFLNQGGDTFLRFAGAKDVRLGQRIAMHPNQEYRLSLDVRTNDPEADLHLRICHRYLIHPTEWNPACVDLGQRVKNTHGEWKHLEFDFNSGELGSFRMQLLSPLVLELGNRREYDMDSKPQTLLDFDKLSLLHTESGEELMRNGDFEHGIDHWFGYYDFNHLPWHIKNLWVNVYFELGIAGLVSFVLLLIASFRGLLAQSSAGNAREAAFSIAVLLALVGFVAVGAFGTMLDIPRVTFLFFLLLLSGLTKTVDAPAPNPRSRLGSASATSRAPASR